jgi:hypothetical protein
MEPLHGFDSTIDRLKVGEKTILSLWVLHRWIFFQRSLKGRPKVAKRVIHIDIDNFHQISYRSASGLNGLDVYNDWRVDRTISMVARARVRKLQTIALSNSKTISFMNVSTYMRFQLMQLVDSLRQREATDMQILSRDVIENVQCWRVRN